MHSISNLMKVNQMNNEKLNYDTMSIDDLRKHQIKFQNMKNNQKLINSLKDKGEKISNTLKKIEEVLQKRTENLSSSKEQEKTKDEKSDSGEVETLVDKLETLFVVKTTEENKLEQEVTTQVKVQNYFAQARTSNKPDKLKKPIDENKLKEIKQKILLKMEKSSKYKSSKEIPVDECFKLLKEHEKKIQELQMQQAAERLLQGQSVKYDFSFIERTDKDNLKYRERVSKDEHFDEEVDRWTSQDEDEDDFYDDDDYYSETGIDRVHKSQVDRNKYKHLSEDLDKVD